MIKLSFRSNQIAQIASLVMFMQNKLQALDSAPTNFPTKTTRPSTVEIKSEHQSESSENLMESIQEEDNSSGKSHEIAVSKKSFGSHSSQPAQSKSTSPKAVKAEKTQKREKTQIQSAKPVEQWDPFASFSNVMPPLVFFKLLFGYLVSFFFFHLLLFALVFI